MAIFRAKEVAQFSDAELVENEQKLKIELIQNYGKVSAGGAPENPGKIREVRRTIARIKTEQTKRQA
ncbi:MULTISPECIES: 50S ribosomal protein L29 [Methanocorpusculum]|jgi:large subunit ribosomal protein L29|uniref:Large ribosomal subunit protein uL29 n=2 Tax=Methanocorpusculum TaxID=2192 RepID=A2SPL0_METLZ|nr:MULTISPECIES: 50S ribosomal protein L29 [Methanocorpusculum]RBQ25312.1 MAG: 50S ribosomal protein L29P [Methanocorpusculum sp. MCE]ABN06266.1 LSU ribosomal protein L29P [Methanocorpusculum labreanum Z]MDD2249388.1 50S ribosomal protein L29 [Methanocorpusculum sp.]MDD2803217.1 50S ribosomal protein L29 [Methanocorpusculum sp.]MDY3203234.1 50S ribosomal protein L29 [Methanocorpusculum sp.]